MNRSSVADAAGEDLGRGPMINRLSVVRDTPQSPYDYPDAFRLPRLPLPLLLKVGKFNRRITALKVQPQPTAKWEISGVTKDSVGAALPACTIDLFVTSTDVRVATTTSDGVGAYSFSVGLSTVYYAVAYLAGSPDVAGTTVITLTGTQV